MSIVTKGGDKGKTSLYNGERISKSDLRVEAYGTMDELDAFIGEAKHQVDDAEVRRLLINIQNRLSRVMATLATPDGSFPKPISEDDVEEISQIIHRYEQKLQIKGFVVPGATVASARLDICRTVARRAERRVIALAQVADLAEPLLKYVNRLSDFFYILARHLEDKVGALQYRNNPEKDRGGTK